MISPSPFNACQTKVAPRCTFLAATFTITCFTHSNSRYGETFSSFVNGQYTSDGGTHLSAFREGLLKAVNEYAEGKLEGDDVRECMMGALAIRLKDPMLESETKNKLGNTETRPELVNTVRGALLHFFNRNKDIATADGRDNVNLFRLHVFRCCSAKAIHQGVLVLDFRRSSAVQSNPVLSRMDAS